MYSRILLALAVAVGGSSTAAAQLKLPKPIPLNEHNHHKDVVYLRKAGMALTMEVLEPLRNRTNAGVIVCISAMYESNEDMVKRFHTYAAGEFMNRGYVVFLVRHSSQPTFTVPEIVKDIHRAVRFIKTKAMDYQIDPDRLGITGASSGGQLSLMIGCAGTVGSTESKDANEQLIEKQSSRVAAVACVFPVTDFRPFENKPPPGFKPDVLFPFRELDPTTGEYNLVTPKRRFDIGCNCSPLLCVTKNAVPTLVIHGDKDDLVPIKQSQDLKKAFDNCGALCNFETVSGMGHTPLEALQQLPKLANWFDEHLRK